MRSIRSYLSLGLVIGVAITGISSGVLHHTFMRRELVDSFDAELLAKAKALASFSEYDGIGVEFDFPETMPEYGKGVDQPEYAQLWLTDGRLIDRSKSLKKNDLPMRGGTFADPEVWDLELPGGERGRAVGVEYVIPKDTDDDDDDEEGERVLRLPPGMEIPDLRAVVVVARSREGLDGTLVSLVTAIGLTTLVMLAVTLVVVLFIVRRGLRPLFSLGERAGRMGARNLADRLPTDNQPRELVAMTTKLNELLERLQVSFERERRMTASLAHELRTPIAELRSASDVAHKFRDDPDLAASLVETTGQVSRRMGRLVSTLLRLVRIEAGAEQAQREAVELEPFLEDAWGTCSASRNGDAPGWQHEGNAVAEVDPALMTIVTTNLLENAMNHGSGGDITSKVYEYDGRVGWALTNEAADLSEEDLAHMTEPFWCKDASRTRVGNAGLGLSLVTAVLDTIGGGVRFELDGSRLRTVLTLPRAV